MVNEVPKTEVPKIERTSLGLRDALFDEIELLREGRGDPTRASAIAKLAAHIISAAKLELQMVRLTQDMGDGRPSMAPNVVSLGTRK